MNGELGNIRRLAATLRDNLLQCAKDPDVDAVHDTRTGTRRLQATLENVVRETPDDDAGQPIREAAAAVMRVLKKIRRAAAPVRDLDVHRKLVEKLTKRARGMRNGEGKAENGGRAKNASAERAGDLLETPELGLRATSLEQQAGELDAWLKDRRDRQAASLKAQAADLPAKFEKRLADLDRALAGQTRRSRIKPPAELALDSFARLAADMQLLDATNLHDFRKGAKKARYVAELAAQEDMDATLVGKTLKRLQDEIGDWHDWLVLADEAQAALEDRGAELTALIEKEREQHFVAAMKMAAKLRGPLIGEWLAAGQSRSRKRRSASSATAARRVAGNKARVRSRGRAAQRTTGAGNRQAP
ncbi:MAG TPA: CHAD domain-containing protein [Acidobacteriaceae bacterium]